MLNDVLYIIGISILGGCIGFYKKFHNISISLPKKISLFIIELISSIFVGFFTYRILISLKINIDIAYGATAIASFCGSGLLEILEKVLFSKLHKIGKDDE